MTEARPGGDPLARLPHTGAARLPDRVVSLDRGGVVRVEMRLLPGDARLNDAGRLPGLLLVELMAQGGGLLIEDARTSDGDYAMLAGVRRMHIHDTASAGETIEVECRLQRRLGDVYLIGCRCRTADRELAHGILQIRRVRKEAG